ATSTSSLGPVGIYRSISLAIGVDGRALISYRAANPAPTQPLNIAHCDDVRCGSASIVTVDSEALSFNTAIAIGSDGRGVVAYYRLGSGTLPTGVAVAHCLD